MATLLTNRKMSPALRARIEASVSRRSPTTALIRLALALTIVVAIVTLLMKRRDTSHALELRRGTLLESLRVRAAPFTPEDRKTLARLEPMLTRLAGPYEGDIDQNVTPGSIVYVRGPVDAFSNPRAIEATATASAPDAFIACFVEPPRNRNESSLLAKVRSVYIGGKMPPRIHRLADAYAAMHALEPAWRERILAAPSDHGVAKLERELERVPFDEGKKALGAEMMVVVLDEPGDAATPAELDGERPHDVRVAVIDPKTGNVVLRSRRRVDPSVWSSGVRPEYASGLDSCAVAFDVRF
jgi:hypothetical protein